jgi:hypothetical protein
MDFHDVSGTVTIVDEDTVRVDDFTYDGDGIVVYFYLGASDDPVDFASGLQIGNDLFGTSFNGSEGPMLIDLPTATTLDGYNAVSVWCVAANASFGSGTFASVPPVSSDLTNNATALEGNIIPSTTVDFADLTKLLSEWTGSAAGSPEAAPGAEAVPEPSGLALLAMATLGLSFYRRRRRRTF